MKIKCVYVNTNGLDKITLDTVDKVQVGRKETKSMAAITYNQ